MVKVLNKIKIIYKKIYMEKDLYIKTNYLFSNNKKLQSHLKLLKASIFPSYKQKHFKN